MLSDAFKNPKEGNGADEINADYLKVFAQLHAVDRATPMEKAKGFYEVLQEGGFDRHKHISAGDKDFEPCFKKIVQFATIDAFNNANFSSPYSESDVETLLNDDVIDELKEVWLEDVYDVKSTLENEAWLQAVTTKGKWIFDACEIRKKLFDLAKVKVKHMN